MDKDLFRVPIIAVIGKLAAMTLDKWQALAGLLCTIVTTLYVMYKLCSSIIRDVKAKDLQEKKTVLESDKDDD